MDIKNDLFVLVRQAEQAGVHPNLFAEGMKKSKAAGQNRKRQHRMDAPGGHAHPLGPCCLLWPWQPTHTRSNPFISHLRHSLGLPYDVMSYCESYTHTLPLQKVRVCTQGGHWQASLVSFVACVETHRPVIKTCDGWNKVHVTTRSATPRCNRSPRHS